MVCGDPSIHRPGRVMFPTRVDRVAPDSATVSMRYDIENLGPIDMLPSQSLRDEVREQVARHMALSLDQMATSAVAIGHTANEARISMDELSQVFRSLSSTPVPLVVGRRREPTGRMLNYHIQSANADLQMRAYMDMARANGFRTPDPDSVVLGLDYSHAEARTVASLMQSDGAGGYQVIHSDYVPPGHAYLFDPAALHTNFYNRNIINEMIETQWPDSTPLAPSPQVEPPAPPIPRRGRKRHMAD